MTTDTCMPLFFDTRLRISAADTAKRRSPCVGKYQVDVASFEKLALPVMGSIEQRGQGKVLVVVDEVGKMELLSGGFAEAVRALFDSFHCTVLGTIPVASHWLIDDLRKRDDCQLYEVINHSPLSTASTCKLQCTCKGMRQVVPEFE